MAKHFTIHRPSSPGYELTIVGRTGQKQVNLAEIKGKDGHFTNEGQYRRAIEKAVKEGKVATE